jgi:hypothetical protein
VPFRAAHRFLGRCRRCRRCAHPGSTTMFDPAPGSIVMSRSHVAARWVSRELSTSLTRTPYGAAACRIWVSEDQLARYVRPRSSITPRARLCHRPSRAVCRSPAPSRACPRYPRRRMRAAGITVTARRRRNRRPLRPAYTLRRRRRLRRRVRQMAARAAQRHGMDPRRAGPRPFHARAAANRAAVNRAAVNRAAGSRAAAGIPAARDAVEPDAPPNPGELRPDSRRRQDRPPRRHRRFVSRRGDARNRLRSLLRLLG